jgi:hypothetical protein
MAAPGLVYTMEMIQTGPVLADLIEKLKPLNTMQQVEELLKANRVAFAWQIADTPSARIPAALAAQFETRPHEVFLLPQPRGGMVITTVLNSRHE